jgi:hypothetical protein
MEVGSQLRDKRCHTEPRVVMHLARRPWTGSTATSEPRTYFAASSRCGPSPLNASTSLSISFSSVRNTVTSLLFQSLCVHTASVLGPIRLASSTSVSRRSPHTTSLRLPEAILSVCAPLKEGDDSSLIESNDSKYASISLMQLALGFLVL